MPETDLQQQLDEARETIQVLQEELAETNSGLVALTLELEQRVDERTAELQSAHAELEQTNTELMQLTLELEDRVEERTSELRATNEEIATISQQLLQSARLATMGELAASIAHELNNPLAIVSLRVESLLAQAPEGDPKHRPLVVIEQEVERMGNLVAHLLEFSRRSGQQISTVDVREEIDNTLELVHYRFHKHGVSVVKDFPSNLPRIHADRSQLRQVFLNVFTNAIDAMRETGGTLTLRVQKAESRKQKAESSGPLPSAACPLPSVLIEISDTGAGIPPEHLAKVMEPFFTTKPEGQGTGLGLPICRRIVQEHHGAFEIDSEVGKGTTVRITLPVANGKNGKMLKEESGTQ